MLSDTQKEAIRKWAQEGAELGEIHQRINDEFGIQMTYLEARLMVADLQVSLDKETEEEEDVDSESIAPSALESDLLGENPPIGGTGGVQVSVDRIAQPHAMISGRVTFSDGKGGAWYLDQMGRLGIDSDEEGYRPPEEDLASFQSQLQETLKSQGF